MSTLVTCGACGVQFSMPDNLFNQRQEDRKSWYCPNGHERCFAGKTDLDKADDKIAVLKNDVAWYQGRNAELRKQVEHWQAVAYGYKGAMRAVQRKIGLVA